MTLEVKNKDLDPKSYFIILLKIKDGDSTITKIFNCTINQCRNVIQRRKYEVVEEAIMTYEDMIDALWKYVKEN